jgi:hypothetical protein
MRQEVVRNVCLPAAAIVGSDQRERPAIMRCLGPKFRWSVAFRFPRQHAELVVGTIALGQ